MNTLEITKKYVKPLFTRSYWQMMADYVGIGKQKKSEVIRDSASLASFLGSRASHVAQTSLYGYLRTRAGTRYPALFENPDILISINIAKWQIWLACVSDLTLFMGQCLYHRGQLKQDRIAELVASALNQVLEETGEPDEAGKDFVGSRDKLLQRVNTRTNSFIDAHEIKAVQYAVGKWPGAGRLIRRMPGGDPRHNGTERES